MIDVIQGVQQLFPWLFIVKYDLVNLVDFVSCFRSTILAGTGRKFGLSRKNYEHKSYTDFSSASGLFQ